MMGRLPNNTINRQKFSSLQVFVSNNKENLTDRVQCGTFSSYTVGQAEFNLVCNDGVNLTSARFVVIELTGVTQPLGVCEIQVVSTKSLTVS